MGPCTFQEIRIEVSIEAGINSQRLVSFPAHPKCRSHPGGASAFALKEDVNSTEVGLQKSRITRRLTVVAVSPGPTSVQDALSSASDGDVLLLKGGTYALESTIAIDKDITIRAENSGQAILDGGNDKRVISISSATVVLEGLHITKGSTDVSPPCLSKPTQLG